ncbi:MAG TPA: NAD-dependent epimerase/dehydratase family protein [Gemmatimonadota bacterium]|jgi:UDP-glucose 4-epimerase
MRVLLSGGAGFIGSHVAERYLAGGWNVVVVDDLSTGRRENVPDGAELVVADLSEPHLDRVLANVAFDLVNHHAAQIDVRASVRDPAHDARLNLIGLLNLLEVARARGMPPVVFASSGGVLYGEADVIPTPETAPKVPISPYGVAKLASEYYLRYYAEVHGLRYVALRYGNVYGPRQNPEGEAGVISIFCNRILEGASLTVFGTGDQERDFVYAGDVAEVNWLASQALASGWDGREERGDPLSVPIGAPAGEEGDAVDPAALNVGTGRAVSVLDLVLALGGVTGRKLERRHDAARPGELLHSTLDASKAARRLGWAPRTPFLEGLDATFRWVSESRGDSR